jgi:hypothetical protein
VRRAEVAVGIYQLVRVLPREECLNHWMQTRWASAGMDHVPTFFSGVKTRITIILTRAALQGTSNETKECS